MKKKKRGGALWAFLIFAVVIALLIADSSVRLELETFEVVSEKLPAAFDGFKIAHISDTHKKVFGDGQKDLISKLCAQKPDIIALTGDIVDDGESDEYLAELVSSLSAVAPVYYVSGNHEWATGRARDYFAIIEENGGTVLRNRFVGIESAGEAIFIAGVDDPNGLYDQKTPKELSDEFLEEEGDAFSVLLSHRNDPETYEDLAFDVILCGHAHGGIIRLPFVGGLLSTDHSLFPDFEAGKYDLGENTMIVSRGIGNSIPVPRFLNNPHVPIIVLKSA